MKKSHLLDENKIIKGQTNYSIFIYTFVNFISEYFYSYVFTDAPIKKKVIAEDQIIHSLLLMEKLHMYLVQSYSSYEKCITISDDTQLFHPLKSNSNYQLFKTLQNLINRHPFIQKDNQILSQKIISQIMSYYPQHSNSITFTISPPSKPWKPDI